MEAAFFLPQTRSVQNEQRGCKMDPSHKKIWELVGPKMVFWPPQKSAFNNNPLKRKDKVEADDRLYNTYNLCANVWELNRNQKISNFNFTMKEQNKQK